MRRIIRALCHIRRIIRAVLEYTFFIFLRYTCTTISAWKRVRDSKRDEFQTILPRGSTWQRTYGVHDGSTRQLPEKPTLKRKLPVLLTTVGESKGET